MREIILDSCITPEYINILKYVLLSNDEFSILPEILDVFGTENFIKFLNLFAGFVIKIPSSEELSLTLRDIDIYHKMSKCSESNKSFVITDLASKYQINEKDVSRISTSMTEKIEKYNKYFVV